MKNRITLISWLATLLAFGLVTSAFAKTPDKEIFEFPSFLVVDCKDWSEFDYQIEFDDMFTVTETTFYNQDDTINRVQAHVKIVGAATNLETGTVFTDEATFNSVFYPNGGEVVNKGLELNLRFEGTGVVAKHVGTITFDGIGNITFVAGQSFDEDFRTTACEGLVGL